jgi:hypothetical protein
MKNGALILVLVVGLLSAGERPGHAEEGPSAGFVYLGLGALAAAHLTLTILDVSEAARNRPLPRLYGALEGAWGLYNMSLVRGSATRFDPLMTTWLVWSTALTAHGVWTLVRPEPELAPPPPPPPSRPPPITLRLAPALLAGRESPVPGAMIAGRF